MVISTFVVFEEQYVGDKSKMSLTCHHQATTAIDYIRWHNQMVANAQGCLLRTIVVFALSFELKVYLLNLCF